jgi:hypothetical protein
MNINKLLDELFNLLDNDINIKKIKKLKSKITNKEIELINLYRNNPTVENKKKLYENKVINEYLTCESNINYLIMEINNKFKRRKSCACNKW